MRWSNLVSLATPLVAGYLLVGASNPTPVQRRNTNGGKASQTSAGSSVVPGNKFVSTKAGKFSVNGSDFTFIGTNAYWLQVLNAEDDLIDVYTKISAAGIQVVRTWGFNDVDVIPENSTWLQHIANGTTTINNGTNGLAKLDAVVKHAEDFGLYLMVTLTNNWNPRPLFDNLTTSLNNLTSTIEGSATPVRRDVTPGTNNTLPRNTLSNDYGGMDTYVRQFGLSNHDEFYTNETIISAFENYIGQVVTRYVNSPAIFAWELANDPRCNSTVSASNLCNSTTITSWLNRTSNYIRSIDPNHLVSGGNQGFFCPECPKLFPVAPPPQTSPVPGTKRSLPKRVTKRSILQERKDKIKRGLANAVRSTAAGGIRIRGKWISTPTRRQDANEAGTGQAFDGSQGIDCEDIMNIPQIGFGTFQLYPDQNDYGFDDPTLSPFNNTVEQGIDWIKKQAELSQVFGKPISLTGFGLVTQKNSPFYVPFNTTMAPFGPDSGAPATTTPYGVTDAERDEAYRRWLDAGLISGLQGIMQYQWGQGNLTGVSGTAISPSTTETGQSANLNETGITPNDGYTIQGQDPEEVQSIFGEAASRVGPDSGLGR